MTIENSFNDCISILKKEGEIDTSLISDGFHTFGDLYEHRIELFITLCRHRAMICRQAKEPELSYHNSVWIPWKTKLHSDGSSFDGWFVLGIGQEQGTQITYHLPMNKWDECYFAAELEKAPPFDGHSSQDVLERLKQL